MNLFSNIKVFDQLASTNSYMLEQIAKHNITSFDVIMAKSQTNGRGKWDKKWLSPIGNLTFSVLLKQEDFNFTNSLIVYAIANCVYLTIQKYLGNTIDIKIKWPNDIFVNGKKISGILVERKLLDTDEFFICGIGINVNKAPISDSTCLSEFKNNIKINFLLRDFLEEFSLMMKCSDSEIIDFWHKNSINKIGTIVRFRCKNEEIKGIFKGISSNGKLLIEIDDRQYEFSSGVFI